MLRRIPRTLSFTLCFSLISFAIIISAIRLILPTLNDNKAFVEDYLSQQLGQEIQINKISTGWFNLRPVMILENIAILNSNQDADIARLRRAFITLDPIQSILNLELTLGPVIITGLHLSSYRDEQKNIRVYGFDSLIQPSDAPQKPIEDINHLLQWLAQQEQILIRNSSIEWRSSDDIVHPIYINHLSLTQSFSSHQIEGQLFIAHETPARITLSGTFEDLGHPLESTKGSWYLATENLALPHFLPESASNRIHSLSGFVSAELWGEIDSGSLVNASGQIQINHFSTQATNTNPTIKIPSADLMFEVSKELNTWKLNIAHQPLIVNDTLIEKNVCHVAYNVLEDHLQLDIDTITLDNLEEVLAFTPYHRLYTDNDINQLAGKLTHIEAELSGPTFQLRQFHADATNLSLQRNNGKLSFDNIEGHLSYKDQHWQAQLRGQQSRLMFPRLFGEPVHLDQLETNISYHQYQQHGLLTLSPLVAKNDDGDFTAEVALRYENNSTSPIISGVAQFSKLKGHIESDWLPKGRFNEKLMQWYQNAIERLTFSDLVMVMQGDALDFPFNQDGVFQFYTDINELTLNFNPMWPSIEKASGSLFMHNDQLKLAINKGLSDQLSLTNTQAHIQSFEQPTLTVSGQLIGDEAGVLGYISKTPLKERIQLATPDAQATGRIITDLNLEIPLFEGEHSTRVSGYSTLEKVNLVLLPGITLSQLSGNLRFTENDFYTDTLSAVLLDSPIHLSSRLLHLKDDAVFETHFSGHISTEVLSRHGFTTIKGLFDGTAPYEAVFRVFIDSDVYKNSLEISSSLEGIAIHAPQPLTKLANEEQGIHLLLEQLANEDYIARAQYSTIANATLRITSKENKWYGATLNIGKQPLAFPTESGLVIKSAIDQANAEEWLDFTSRWFDASTSGETTQGLTLNKADLTFNELNLFGLPATQAKLSITQNADAYGVTLASNQASGSVQVPINKQKPIKVDLQYLNLVDVKSNRKSSPQAFSLTRPLTFNLEQLEYRNYPKLGLSFSAESSHADSFTLNNLKIKSPKAELNGQLHWKKFRSESRSDLQGVLNISDIDKALEPWGINSGIKDTKGAIHLDIHWPNGPLDFKLNEALGDLRLDFKEGRLVDVDPGASRILGLLSLQSLKRRLTLDFSDLYSKGLSFDRIQGNVKLDSGNLYTCDTQLVGPSVRIDLQGRTGLVTQDFQQIAQVALNVADPVPYIIAIINPLAGALTWFGKEMFNKQIGNLTAIKYAINGHWDDPEISVVKTPFSLNPTNLTKDSQELHPSPPLNQAHLQPSYCSEGIM